MLIFLSGAVPGLAAYASGPHIWGPVLDRFPGAKPLGLEGETVDAMVEALKRRIDQPAHLVAHDVAGLVALLAAAELPQRVRSVSVVSSAAAAPSGDGVPNLTLAHPPLPLWGRESQRWALERVSYSHHHVDDALLDACVAAPRTASSDTYQPSLHAAKSRFYALCREQGYPVPAQVIWGTHDPLSSFEHGLWLFRILAAKQKAVHFHAINRAGALPFREEPAAFHQIVAAFIEGVAAEKEKPRQGGT
jgi:pimeloyl-ACP methyl ester carboxylesterase